MSDKDGVANAGQIIHKLEKRILELESLILKTVYNSKEVKATSRNTPSVRKGFGMSGYVKHYIISTVDFNELERSCRLD